MNNKTISFGILIILTLIPSYFLASAYFSPSFSGNNSMGGLAYMIVAPILSVFITLFVISIFLIIKKRFNLPEISFTAIILIPAIIINVSGNFFFFWFIDPFPI
ncbi:MAG: hypothetical protein V1859_09170 [archaeon]